MSVHSMDLWMNGFMEWMNGFMEWMNGFMKKIEHENEI